jgi:hypothetical protein
MFIGDHKTAYERGVEDGRIDRRNGLTYIPGSADYEQGYQDGYQQMRERALGIPFRYLHPENDRTPRNL